MKVFSIFNNYTDDNTGRNISGADWIIIPDSALTRSGKPVFLPGEDGEYNILFSLCVKISRLGKCISPKFARRYYSELAPAVQFIPSRCIEEISKGYQPKYSSLAFDNAIVIGDFIRIAEPISDNLTINLSLTESNKEFGKEFRNPDIGKRFTWHINKMKLSVDELTSMVSMHNTLKMGDLILCALHSPGLPALRGSYASLRLDTASHSLCNGSSIENYVEKPITEHLSLKIK